MRRAGALSAPGIGRNVSSPTRYQPEDFQRFEKFLGSLAKHGLGPKLSSQLDPADVVQTVFLKACSSRRTLRASTDAGVAAWLRTILQHTLATARAKARKQAERIGSQLPWLDPEEPRLGLKGRSIVDATLPPSIQLEEEESLLQLTCAVNGLPEVQREVVLLRHWHSWPLRRIAHHVGRTEASVAGLIRRGLKRLEQQLQDTAV
jgi:RNA polymerase sigma-70 factor (ECF subfamily)